MTVTVSFPTDSADAGKATMEAWTLSEGCMIMSAYSETMPNLATGEGTTPAPLPPPDTPEYERAEPLEASDDPPAK
jgi:hypothetical protein